VCKRARFPNTRSHCSLKKSERKGEGLLIGCRAAGGGCRRAKMGHMFMLPSKAIGRPAGWLDGWMAGWMDGGMEGWTGGCGRPPNQLQNRYDALNRARAAGPARGPPLPPPPPPPPPLAVAPQVKNSPSPASSTTSRLGPSSAS